MLALPIKIYKTFFPEKNIDQIPLFNEVISTKDIRSEIRALIEEFRELYDGDFSDEAVSLLLTELSKLAEERPFKTSSL